MIPLPPPPPPEYRVIERQFRIFDPGSIYTSPLLLGEKLLSFLPLHPLPLSRSLLRIEQAARRVESGRRGGGEWPLNSLDRSVADESLTNFCIFIVDERGSTPIRNRRDRMNISVIWGGGVYLFLFFFSRISSISNPSSLRVITRPLENHAVNYALRAGSGKCPSVIQILVRRTKESSSFLKIIRGTLAL